MEWWHKILLSGHSMLLLLVNVGDGEGVSIVHKRTTRLALMTLKVLALAMAEMKKIGMGRRKDGTYK